MSKCFRARCADSLSTFSGADSDQGRSRFSVQQLPFEIRPELGCQVADEIEPELKRALGESEAYRVEPARIPRVRNVSRTVSAADAPNGQRLSSFVRMGQNGAAERMSGATPESAALGPEIAGILVQGCIQAKCESTMDPGAGDGGSEALPVAGPALSPSWRRIGFLEDCGVRRIPDERERTNGLLDMEAEFVGHSQCSGRLSESRYGNRKDYGDDEH